MPDWGGRKFPRCFLGWRRLPDAYVHREGLLPHLHEELEDLFPKAVACEDAGDQDPPSCDGLGKYGTALGQAPGQKKEAVVVSSNSLSIVDEI